MEFVNFSIAKKLKEKGFKEECLCHYIGEDLFYNIESPIANKQLWFSHNKFNNIWHRDNYDAPTISQVVKWLRKEKKIYIEISLCGYYYHYMCLSTIEIENDIYGWHKALLEKDKYTFYDTYEKAALAGIKYVLDNLIT